jgi:integrase
MAKKKTKADTVSAQGGKWLKKNLNNPKISNHSFRHTMIDRLREVGCPPEVFNALTGWATDGMAKNYGDGYSLKKKHEWLSKVVF